MRVKDGDVSNLRELLTVQIIGEKDEKHQRRDTKGKSWKC